MSKLATAELQQALLSEVADQSAATDVIAITADQALPTPSRAIRCLGTGGKLRVQMASGNTRDTSIDTGQVLPWAILKVVGTGTEATQLEAWL